MNPFRRSTRPSSLPIREVDDPTENCFFKTTYFIVTTIHAIELIFGLTLIGYSIALHSQPNDPQNAIAIIFTNWALLSITASGLGALGFSIYKCRRIPLTISAYLGVLIALFDFVILIILIQEKETLYNYFKEKHEAMYLSEGLVEYFHDHAHLLYSTLIFHIIVELTRFYFIPSLKEDLCFYDEAKRNGLIREKDEEASAEREEWNNNPMNDVDDSNLNVPLISSDTVGTSSSSAHVADNYDFDDNNNDSSKWWERDTEALKSSGNGTNNNDEEFMSSIEHEPKGFMSLFARRSDFCDNNVEDSTNQLFAPVDEELDFQEPATKAGNIDLGFPNPRSWFEEDDSKGEANEPDLSWIKEDPK